MLWPALKDREAPWITELGWTVVPPNSDPQQLHADIVAEEEPDDAPRSESAGRFQHVAWKPAVKGKRGCCSTQVVPGAFSNGASCGDDYNQLHDVASPCVVCDASSHTYL